MMEQTHNRRPRRRSTISHVSDYQPSSNSYDGQYGASYNNATVGYQMNSNDYHDNYHHPHNSNNQFDHNDTMNSKQYHDGHHHRGTTTTTDRQKIERRVVDEMRVATQNMQSRHRDMNLLRPAAVDNNNMRPRRRSSMPMVSDWVLEQRKAQDDETSEKVHSTGGGATRNTFVPTSYPELSKEAYIHESMDDYFLNKNVREMIEHDNKYRKGGTGKKPSRQMSEPITSQEKRERSLEDTDTSKVDRLLLATKDAFDKFMDGFNKEQEETLIDAQTRDDQLLQATKSVIDKIKSGFIEKPEGQGAQQQPQDGPTSSSSTTPDENLLQGAKNAFGKFIRNLSESQRNMSSSSSSLSQTSLDEGRWTTRFQGFMREDSCNSFTSKMFQRLGQ